MLQRPSRIGVTLRQSSSARLVLVAALAALLVLASAVGASADPSIQDKRAQAQAVLAEVQALDEEVGAAAERYNGANYELQALTSDLAETRADLKRVRAHLRVARERVAARLRALYLEGDPGSAVEVILGARSLDELIDGLAFAERVSAQDAAIARGARALRERVAEREEELDAARDRQVVIVEQRASEKQAIEASLAERQRLLASVQEEVSRLEEAERRRQEELRLRAAAELARQQRAAAEAARARVEESVSAADTQAPAATPLAAPDVATPAPAPPADASKGAQVVAIAMQYLGIPYKWGGASPSTGFDCSGLTMYVFAQVGVSLPHYAAAQYQLGVAVSKSELQPGDLVFFRALGHMGMYIGGGKFIHAPRTGDVVKISSLSEPYYVANWVGARRVL